MEHYPLIRKNGRYMGTNKNGFTILELMITIAIAGILSAIALPSLNEFTVKMRVDNEIREVQRLLLTTRNAAINSGSDAFLCPLKNDDTCNAASTYWAGRIGVVTVDGLIKERAEINSNDELVFGFSNVTYNATGQLANNNTGTFSYCPKSHSKLSRGIELNISGRAILTQDTNGDGIDQTRAGVKVSC